jgi:hypothetical protein
MKFVRRYIMKKQILIVLTLVLCLTAFGCAQKKPLSSNDTTDTEMSTVDTEKITDSSNAISENEDPPVDLPDMVIADGFTVVESSVVNVFVTEDGAKTKRHGRAAVLKNDDNGDFGLYLDVISDDNTVMCYKRWVGYCQMFMDSEGTIIVFQVTVRANNSAAASYQLFEISDKKQSGYDIVELDTPEINAVSGEGETLNFGVGDEAVYDRYRLPYDNITKGLEAYLSEREEKGVFMIADCYLNVDDPSIYSIDEGIAIPNFEDKEIRDKYTLDHVFELEK